MLKAVDSKNVALSSTSDDDEKAARSEGFIKSMIAFADRPLKELIAIREGVDIVEKWGTQVMVDTGHITVEQKNGTKHNIKLAIVPKNYMLELGELTGDQKALEAMAYLIHCAQCLFQIIKEKNDVGNRSLKVDMESSTLYFHSNDEKRLGINIQQIESSSESQSDDHT